jgi:adenine-specific DNA-methyltransferase
MARKLYLDEVVDRVTTNYWPYAEVGHTDEAKKELIAIFSGHAPFETVKPTRLIDRILHVATDDDSIVLDSFAGSGTTGHSVIKANNRDNGNRKFILIELMDYADSITAERIRRVIDGYSYDKRVTTTVFDQAINIRHLKNSKLLDEANLSKTIAEQTYDEVKSPKIKDGHLVVEAITIENNTVPGLSGGFDYCELGEQLLTDGQFINESIPDDVIADYVWYMETRQPKRDETDDNDPYYLGTSNNTAYYFYYEKDALTTLDTGFLARISIKAENYIIYADQCAINDDELKRSGITFKKIPRDISRL